MKNRAGEESAKYRGGSREKRKENVDNKEV